MMKKIVPSFRRYSEPLVSEFQDDVDFRRIPPIHDLVETKNEKNGKLCREDIEEDVEATEEIDEEWFMKVAKRSENSSERVPPYDGITSDGNSCTEIPLLFGDDLDFKERTMRTFRRGMKKIWRRGSATITEADPTNKVIYLGNYLTGWAKGEGCVEKPLHTIWKNYSTSTKPDVQMKLTVTQSGLKAVTKDHGLTEYWSHRITYCSAPDNLPRVFCWVYRHEGRKLKQELRCHAVLCAKESTAKRMASTLRLRLTQALSEFKRDKLLKQNARLSLANSVYENPSLPRRKILLSIGSQNYRPPLERSKSAPKLMSIEESLEEEDNSPKEEEDAEAEDGKENPRAEEKSDFKITNLNFVKKLCSSIENLVESTSNYGKKLLSERRHSKEGNVALRKMDDSILKKSNASEEEDDEQHPEGRRKQKNVKFEGEETEPEVVLEVKDPESDEGSNSLQSNSSWSSDVSSTMTTSSEKNGDAKDGDYFLEDRLHTYLDSLEEGRVELHPRGDPFPMTRIDRGEADSLSSEEDNIRQEEDDVSDESGYVELTDSIVTRLSIDRKEKDVPYHQIIKTNLLRPRRFESSCLQV
ncbi:UNVERIFIED_CONTAM: hypothetical protein PYX00_002516 [Menopon gallinae]|uniref:PID domain-containing protein n=1 Tax=Menopon gallinae TaxID=328185 RepID=A0AAW2IHC0_9NEOP